MIFPFVLFVLASVMDVNCGHGSIWADCNTKVYIEDGDSYSLDRFPPPFEVSLSAYSAFYFNRGRLPQSHSPAPRECTIEFETVDDCALEFRTSFQERGDIDCQEQYLVIGDENREDRVCGLGRPPRYWHSTGSKLFLTHYQRNSRGRATISSQIGGIVRCRQGSLTRKSKYYKNEYYNSNVNNATNGTEPGNSNSTCFPQTNQTQIDPFGSQPAAICQNSGQDCLLHASLGVVNGSSVGFGQVCHALPGQQCWFNAKLFYSFLPLNSSCDGPLPPIPHNFPGNCSTGQVSCPRAHPNCDYTILVSYIDQPPFPHTCALRTQPNAICSVQAIACTFVV